MTVMPSQGDAAGPTGNQGASAGPQQPDLSSCEAEAIHLLGHVQPFGFLVAVTNDWRVAYASRNVEDWLGRPAEALLDQPLRDFVGGDVLHTVRGRLQIVQAGDGVERIFRIPLTPDDPRLYDLALHLSQSLIVIEAEPSPARDEGNAGTLVRSAINQIQKVRPFPDFCREAARQMRAFTGFERAMIYRFDADGAGEVIAESVRPGLESYMGLHYPASDIPRQARSLYERNWLRLIADVDAPPSPVIGAADMPLDLSLSVLRSVSPVHLEYLRNLGVRGSLSVSILRDGRLWGLIACHDERPRFVSLERRTSVELFGQMFSFLLETRERATEAELEGRARHIQNKLMSMLAGGRVSAASLASIAADLRDVIACDGVAVLLDGKATVMGNVPDEAGLRDLAGLLSRRSATQIFSTDHLAADHPPAEDWQETAAGLLALPVSRTGQDYVLLFRRAVTRTVVWAGNPAKAVEGERIGPRRSFAAWAETVRDHSLPWTEGDHRIAETMRITILDVILRLTGEAERDRKNAQERQDLLIAELNHRVRNILGLIRGLVAQSKAGANTVDDFVAVIGDRIQALARAHDQVTEGEWGPGSLRALLLAEAGAYLGDKAERVALKGPGLLLDPLAFGTIALVIHELMTNSAKYGALSDSGGRVDIEWLRDERQRLVLHWRESGGPAVQAPLRRGFGTTIIERSIPFDLKGEAEVNYARSGVEARLVIPARFVVDNPEEAAIVHSPVPEETTLTGPVLIVEDNLIIALDAEEIFARLGVREVASASNVAEGLAALERRRPKLALLDINLGAETSFKVAEALQAAGVPFIFASGYGESQALPPHLRNVPAIKKPYTPETIKNAVALACRLAAA